MSISSKAFCELTKNKQIIAVICNQWGDTGKGKFSDYFAINWADVNARGTGGNNAGHTIVINGKKRIFHFLPAGILYDNRGKITILGNGMVIDIKELTKELNELDKENLSFNNLMISQDAHIIMPYHIIQDQKKHTSLKKGNIGSTGRGIGPCYTDKIARRGIMIRDLFDNDILVAKIKKIKEYYPRQKINSDQIINQLKPYIKKIKPFVRDTIAEMENFRQQGKKILLEGAQGLLLSIEFGAYPYVTSSDCSINGTSSGVGLSAKAVDLVLGVVKFPFMTRVGAGPFPSEFAGQKSENYCADGLKHNLIFELKKYNILFENINGKIKYDHHHKNIIKLINNKDEFKKGIGIRLAGEEYGATTNRPRRIGWTDLEVLKYAAAINGPNLILTKADVLRFADCFNLVYGYKFDRDANYLQKVKVKYKTFRGFSEDISKIKNFGDLPNSLKKSINYLEKHASVSVKIISTGPDQNQTIIR